MRKFMIHAAIAAVAILAVATSASAQLTKIVNGGGNTSDPYITWSQSTGLSIFTDNGNSVFAHSSQGLGTDGDAILAFYSATTPPAVGTAGTPLTPGAYQFNQATGGFKQQLDPGSFILSDASTKNVLLEGFFGESTLAGTNGSASSGLTLNLDTLTYTGGSYFPATGYFNDGGTLSFAFNSTGSTISANKSGLSPFSATDVVTFEANQCPTPPSVPEPASSATFGIGALGVLALAFAAKRRSAKASA